MGFISWAIMHPEKHINCKVEADYSHDRMIWLMSIKLLFNSFLLFLILHLFSQL